MTCDTPIPYERLVALWSGDLDADAAAAVDDHLFACDACAATSERLGALVAGLLELIPPVISHTQRDRLAARGMHLRHTDVEPGRDEVEAVYAPEVDLLVHVLHGDLARADRVDLDLLDPDGESRLAMVDVPFDRARGEVLIACQRHYRGLGHDPVFQLHVHEHGRRRELGKYRVRHVWM